MPNKAPDKLPPGPELDALTALKVFGWKNVHKHDGALVSKKQDKAGHWRTAKVPHFSTDPVNAYAIDERMKQLGRSEQYAKELFKIATAKKVPNPTGRDFEFLCQLLRSKKSALSLHPLPTAWISSRTACRIASRNASPKIED